MMHKAWSSIEEVPYCFSMSSVKFQGHTAKKKRRIWPKLGVSGLKLQFEFIDGYEMLHKAWNNKGEMPYCFPRSSIKFQGHTGQNITDFDPNWAFPDYRPVAAFKSLRFALLLWFCCTTKSFPINFSNFRYMRCVNVPKATWQQVP